MIVTDYNGQVIEFAGSEEDALEQGYNVNCRDCMNCSGCFNCVDCSDCKFCDDCIFCSKCMYCINCSDNNNCIDNNNCKYCIHCKTCRDCSECVHCSYCNNCSHCNSCRKCENCNQCNCCYCCKNFTNPIVLVTDIWRVQIDGEIMQIGCKQFTIEEWFAFSDKEIAKIDAFALKWWKKWKEKIRVLIN